MNEIYEIGKFKFIYTEMLLIDKNSSAKLSRKECDLLRLLTINKNQLLEREIALIEIWGKNDYFYGRSMDVYLTKLRKRLKSDNNVSIVNVHGKGFILETKN
ncbi:winged helix-turn-helix domain-containing protein [Bacteroidota bacterium]